MKQKLKRLAIKLFLGDKFRGRISTAVAGAIASWLLSYIPGAPAFVEFVLRLILELPEKVTLTQEAVAAALVLPVSYFFDACIQEFLLRQNNKSLQVIRDNTSYDGPIDGLVGAIARAAIEEKNPTSFKTNDEPAHSQAQHCH